VHYFSGFFSGLKLVLSLLEGRFDGVDFLGVCCRANLNCWVSFA
jgi:hypothetical protein